ncbi:MAG: hypothetical protein FWG40_12550 [Peptococcaceae bacterium]|nr:hypothetical protein [Peptococcaceae bacterium]
MAEGTNQKGETSAYHHNSLGALVGETKHITRNAYGYYKVDADPKDPKAGCCKDKSKTAHIEITNTIDYTSPLLDKLVEKETNGLTYKYIYGAEKISVDIIEEGKKRIEVDTYYVHHDRLGSTDSLTDKNRCLRSSAGYDPWGAPKKSDPLLTDCRKIDLVTEFTTYTHNPILDVYYAKARMYDAENRRFTAQDIFPGIQQNPQTLNRYAYVTNNPRTYIDPTGELAWFVIPLIIIAVSSLAVGGTYVVTQATAGGGWDWSRVDWREAGLAFGAGAIGGLFIATGFGIAAYAAAYGITLTTVTIMAITSSITVGMGITTRALETASNPENTGSDVWRNATDAKMVVADAVAGAFIGLTGPGANLMIGGLVARTGFGAFTRGAIQYGAVGFIEGYAYSGITQAMTTGKVDHAEALTTATVSMLFAGVPGGFISKSVVKTSAVANVNKIRYAGSTESLKNLRRVNVRSSQGSGNETFYRAMSETDYQSLLKTGKLPSTSETFISPSRAYASQYDGILVRFNVKSGTTSSLKSIGVRDTSNLTTRVYGNMPVVRSGWTKTNAFFKGEGQDLINIGLGRGNALDIFNRNISGFQALRR